ncbi:MULTISPECIES: nuclear transport factor 2 family protein [unclassified Sinorhizobium]|uniref:nuclear transport factor 2 family protein n=1 Tax=unclassified Sinorhizobium TaxID=2613772 RepID=UPI003525416A
MTVPAIVCAVITAVNQHDTDRFLSLFEEDGAVDDWGRVFSGRQEIRAWSDEELIGVDATFELKSTEENGNVVSMDVVVDGEGFTGPSTFSFEMNGPLISNLKIRA